MGLARRAVNLLCAVWVVLFWSWHRAVDWATCEGAYRYFTMARNIAGGHGSTFDRVHRTNDLHSIWLAICTVPYALGLDDETAVRALLTAQMAGLAFALHVALRVLERRAAGNVAGFVLVALVLSPWGISLFANGLETTVAIVAFAVVLDRLDADERTRADRFALAGAAAIAFLTHPIGIVLVPWLVAIEAARGWKRAELVDLAQLPVLVACAAMLFELWRFGSPLPPARNVVHPAFAAIALGAGGAAIAGLVRRQPSSETGAFLKRTSPAFGWAITAAAFQIAVHRTLEPSDFALAAFGFACALGVFAADATGNIDRASRIVSLVAPAAAALVVGRGVMDVFSPARSATVATAREAGLWMRDNLELAGVLGSWDAGVLAYFSRRRTFDLGARDVSQPVPIDYVVAGARDDEGGVDALRARGSRALGGQVKWTVVRTWHYQNAAAARPTRAETIWLVRLD